jgi:Secretion system C-terminal sorting domain
MKYITILLLCMNLGLAQEKQQMYEIPFPEGTGASQGNTIELTVANTSSITAEAIKVEATSIPVGLQFKEKTVTLTAIKSKEEQAALFTFSVEKIAKVNKEDTLRFTITDKTGQRWTKEITIKILPPAAYELFQNYPNPFNPTTVISYQLSAISNVSMKIYDILGREIITLVNERQDAGYYQKAFDAHRFASGMYIYRLLATDDQNNHRTFQKKMLMIK